MIPIIGLSGPPESPCSSSKSTLRRRPAPTGSWLPYTIEIAEIRQLFRSSTRKATGLAITLDWDRSRSTAVLRPYLPKGYFQVGGRHRKISCRQRSPIRSISWGIASVTTDLCPGQSLELTLFWSARGRPTKTTPSSSIYWTPRDSSEVKPIRLRPLGNIPPPSGTPARRSQICTLFSDASIAGRRVLSGHRNIQPNYRPRVPILMKTGNLRKTTSLFPGFVVEVE